MVVVCRSRICMNVGREKVLPMLAMDVTRLSACFVDFVRLFIFFFAPLFGQSILAQNSDINPAMDDLYRENEVTEIRITISESDNVLLHAEENRWLNIYVKAEYFNPASSVKDRLAISIIDNAEKNNLLKEGQTIVEATSGNTGVGLAMVCAAKKYPLVVTMPDSASVERRKLMRFLGAKVLLTPASEGGTGAYDKAKKLVDKNGWFFARQFETEDNANIHLSLIHISEPTRPY